MAYPKSSIIQKVLQDIYNCSTYEEAKKILINTIQNSRINPDNKNQMMSNIRDIEERFNTDKSKLQALQVYATNSMFQKLGMSNTRKSFGY